MRTEIIIRATRTQNVLGEKGRRIRELTSMVQKRFKFAPDSVELYAEKVSAPGSAGELCLSFDSAFCYLPSCAWMLVLGLPPRFHDLCSQQLLAQRDCWCVRSAAHPLATPPQHAMKDSC